MPTDWTHAVDIEALAARVRELPWGARRAYQEDVARGLGVTYPTLRRAIARHAGKDRQVERQPDIPDRLVETLATVKETYRLVTKKGDPRELSTEAAIGIMAREGVEGADDWSTSTYNAALRRTGYRTPQVRRRIEPDHACQEMQLDFSRSKHFQIIGPTECGLDWRLKVSAKELHYKDGAVKLRAWVCQLLDSYSRLRLVRYYPATAESGILGVRFLAWCWGAGPESAEGATEGRHAMTGHLPEMLRTDQGPFRKSQEGRTLIERLKMDAPETAPGHSESQGKVEAGFRSLWQSFEAQLVTRIVRERGEGAVITLSELSAEATRYAVEQHHETHPTKRASTRGQLYQQSTLRHRPRRCPTGLLDVAARTWERKADKTRLLYIDSVPYEVPAYAASQWVRIHKNVSGDLVGELIDGYRAGKPFTVKPYDFAAVDDFSGRPQVWSQERARAAKEEAAAARLGYQEQNAVRPLVPRGEPFEPDTPFAEVARRAAEPERLAPLEARARVGRALTALGLRPADYADVVAERITAPVTAAEADAITATLTQAYYEYRAAAG